MEHISQSNRKKTETPWDDQVDVTSDRILTDDLLKTIYVFNSRESIKSSSNGKPARRDIPEKAIILSRDRIYTKKFR